MSGSDETGGPGGDGAKVVPLEAHKRRRGPACPICGKPEAAQHRPFCSAHCKNVDLGRWLSERYRVPTDEAPDGPQGGGDDDDPGPQSA
ncbi:DNA gyrase inhibitor YacG [Fodinicurvata halophila]|uniref:DNA gyrase inhibitor YacG n=1 Tax=Fodinicurvata halophila TaxID=1419723 RepID=A0ABV8UR43_9PROT